MLSRIIISQTQGSIAIEVQRAKMDVRPGKFERVPVTHAEAQRLRVVSSAPRAKFTPVLSGSGNRNPAPQKQDSGSSALYSGIDAISSVTTGSLDFVGSVSTAAPYSGQGGNMVSVNATRQRVDFNNITTIDPSYSRLPTNWEWIEGSVEYTPHEINISMARYPSIEISIEPGVELEFPMNTGVGLSIDKAV